MLLVVVGHTHLQEQSFFVYLISFQQFFSSHYLEHLSLSDQGSGLGLLEPLHPQILPEVNSVGLSIQKLVFSITQSELKQMYIFPFGSSNSSFDIRVGRIIMYFFILGFYFYSLFF